MIDKVLEKVHSGGNQGKTVISIDPDQIEKEKQLGAS